MTIEGGRSGIVQHGLIRDRDGEHRSEDERCLSGTQGEGDVKSQDEANNIGSIVDRPQIDPAWAGFGSWEIKLMGLIVVLPVLVGELKLRAPFLDQDLFPLVEFIDLPYPMRAGIVTALIDGHFLSLLPGEEGALAVGAVVLGLTVTEAFLLLKPFSTDLAQELRSFLSVIVVEVVMGGLAVGAAGALRDPRGAGPVFYWG
jgi:hypothetical protein